MATQKLSTEVLNIDRFLGGDPYPKNRIAKVGVELEGGWTYLQPDANLVHDGSVTNLKKAGGPAITVGELPSPPKLPVQMWKWMRDNYPSHINDTCGMHVHMSFLSSRHYSQLMVIEYQNTMIEYLKRWATDLGLAKEHPIWPRLEGKNRFCQLKFWPDKQVAQSRKSHDQNAEGHRYTAINFCHGLNGNGTLEVRVLPMMDNVDQGISAVKRVLAVTNACLLALARREKQVKGDVVLDPRTTRPYIDHSIELIRG